MATPNKQRRCSGCGEIKPLAGTRGPRGAIKRFCETCLTRHEAAKPAPLDLLKRALPHVPADLAQQIAEVVPCT